MPSLPCRIGLAALLLASTVAAQTNIDLRSLTSGRGVVVMGEGGLMPPYPSVTPLDGALGTSVTWADLNGDGFDDFVVGAPLLPNQPSMGDTDSSGHVYVVFGRADAANPGEPGDLDFKSQTCVDVLDLVGGLDDRVGYSVANAGDVDGDGIDDLIIGAPDCGPNFRGAAYLLYGAADLQTLPPTLTNCRQNLTDWLGTRTTLLTGVEEFSQAGTSVGGDVDVNADGLSDVVLGAPLASTNSRLQNGQAFVLYGDPALKGTATVDLGSLLVGDGLVLDGADDLQLLGMSVAGIGNFDPVLPGGGEHLTLGDDMAFGAPGTTGPGGLFAGAVYVLRGVTAGNHPTTLDTDDFGAGLTAGPVWHGAATGDQLGISLAPARDLVSTGDGFDELLASAPLHDALGRQDAGSLYIIAGRLAGVGPEGFHLADLGSAGPGEQVLCLAGPTAFVGQDGVVGSPVGDLDGDGILDVAVAFPGATASEVIPTLAKAGTIDVVSGALLGAPLDATVDLATLAEHQLIHLRGETAGAFAGTALAMGDHDNDGHADLAVGSPESPSDADPADPTGLALTETGRGQVLYGPLERVGSFDPVVSWKDGPSVTMSVFNLQDIAGVSVTLDGAPATLSQVLPGTPGTIVIEPPVPPVPGQSGDVVLTTPQSVVTLPDAFTFEALAIDTGPIPSTAVPDVQIDFTGQAFSEDLVVTIGGVVAPLLEVDTLAGTLAVEAPSGLPALTPLDVSFVGSNGNVLLADAVTYEPFVILEVTPTTGPQDAGVFFANPGGVGFEGQPAVTVSFDIVTSDGIFPPDTTVEFGTDALGYKEAEITNQAGTLVEVDLPFFFLGPTDTVVNLRVSGTVGGNAHEVVLDDLFTYEASDFTQHAGTASVGLGTDPPQLLMAGGFAIGEELLFLFDNYAPGGDTQFLFLTIGIAQIQPPLAVKGVLLGATADLVVTFPGFALPPTGTFPFSFSFQPTPDQDGLSLYFQMFTSEDDGVTDAIAASDVMEMEARVD
jgi:hypothetical protein